MEKNVYYRPEWTCGRYDEKKRAAIYYNLIEGYSYFFEDYSATVVGTILSIDKNNRIDVGAISEKTGISLECLIPFFRS